MMAFKDRIQKSGGASSPTKRLILLEGPNGSGKTFQFRTLLEGIPPHVPPMNGLFVTTENKQGTLQGLDFDVCYLQSFDFPTTPAEKATMLKSKTSDLIEMMDFIRNEDHSYDFVYFDSIMRYGKRMFEFLADTTMNGEGDKDTRKAYLLFGKKMLKFLDTISQLTSPGFSKKPVHFIGTWGVESGTDYLNRRQIVPLVDGKMVGPEIGYYFDEVFMLGCDENYETGKQSYVLNTMGGKDFAAKKSSPFKLPGRIIDPNLTEIIAVLEGKLDAKVLRKA